MGRSTFFSKMNTLFLLFVQDKKLLPIRFNSPATFPLSSLSLNRVSGPFFHFDNYRQDNRAIFIRVKGQILYDLLRLSISFLPSIVMCYLCLLYCSCYGPKKKNKTLHTLPTIKSACHFFQPF